MTEKRESCWQFTQSAGRSPVKPRRPVKNAFNLEHFLLEMGTQETIQQAQRETDRSRGLAT
jgi:hypothetical protein